MHINNTKYEGAVYVPTKARGKEKRRKKIKKNVNMELRKDFEEWRQVIYRKYDGSLRIFKDV